VVGYCTKALSIQFSNSSPASNCPFEIESIVTTSALIVYPPTVKSSTSQRETSNLPLLNNITSGTLSPVASVVNVLLALKPTAPPLYSGLPEHSEPSLGGVRHSCQVGQVLMSLRGSSRNPNTGIEQLRSLYENKRCKINNNPTGNSIVQQESFRIVNISSCQNDSGRNRYDLASLIPASLPPSDSAVPTDPHRISSTEEVV
jgi:hypothetical protein